MQVDEKLVGDVLVITPQDSHLDASVAKPLKQLLTERTQKGCLLLVLNLDKVEFMDSSGLTVMISILKSLKGRGGYLVLCEVGAELTSLFQLTRLDKVFQIYSTSGQAVRALTF